MRAVTRAGGGGLAFDGGGAVVDWVLEMRRFGAEDLFDRMAEAHRLTPQLMRDLADIIADFHRSAEIVAGRGGSATLDATITGNNANLRLAAPPLDRGMVDTLCAASRERLIAVGPLLDRRRDHGLVRRCHGDLHLRNICLFEGRPTLFDGIEFNDDFACIDPLYDLAFLLMDLAHRGLAEFGNLIFNRYLDRTGDSDGLAAMPLFLSLRAAVRAHVLGALLRSAGGEAQDAATAQEARAYLALALALLSPCRPRLIAVGGLSGSGKSTVAAALAAGLAPTPGARVIRTDTLRKRLAGVAPETRLPPTTYTLEASRRVYAALDAEAGTTLAAGYSVIADAAFLRPEERQAIAATAQAVGVPFTGLWLEAPAHLLARRVEERRADASDADRRIIEHQLAMDIGTLDWHPIDASGDTASTIAAARAVSATETPERSLS